MDKNLLFKSRNKKKEVNLQSPKNYNIIINKDQNNNNTQVQTKSNNIKEKNTTSNSPNIKNLGVQKEELERFSSLSEMDLSPVSNNNSGNGNNTIPFIKELFIFLIQLLC